MKPVRLSVAVLGFAWLLSGCSADNDKSMLKNEDGTTTAVTGTAAPVSQEDYIKKAKAEAEGRTPPAGYKRKR